MNKEKYIEELYSNSKRNKGSLTGYAVNMPMPNGKKYWKRFKISDYTNKSACKKAAMLDRDEQTLLFERVKKNEINIFDSYSVQQLFDLIPDNYPLSIRSVEKIGHMYGKYIGCQYQDYDIKNITVEHVLGTLKECAKKCSNEHVADLKSIWRKIFEIAKRKKVISENIVNEITKNPKSHNYTKRSLSEQNITETDFQAFCEAMINYGNYIPSQKDLIYNRQIMLYMLKVMRLVGIRSQEARAIRKENIDLYENDKVALIWIRKSIGSNYTETNVEVSTKTPYSVRQVPLCDEGYDLIVEIMNYSKHDLLFADYNGNPITTDDFSSYLYRVKQKCGIDVYATLMRKSMAADMYANGTNPTIIKQNHGHKDEYMSLNNYSSVGISDIIQAVRNRKYKE